MVKVVVKPMVLIYISHSSTYFVYYVCRCEQSVTATNSNANNTKDLFTNHISQSYRATLNLRKKKKMLWKNF